MATTTKERHVTERPGYEPRVDSVYEALPGERYTPFSLGKKLGAKAIFESASFAHGRSRYSTLMVDEGFRLRQNEKDVTIVVDGEERVFLKEGEGDVLDALAMISAENTVPPNRIPIPSSGVGYLGYEFCARCDAIRLAPQVDELNIPEAEFLVGHIYVVFDHFTEKLHLFALNYEEHKIDLRAAIERVKARLADLDFSYLAPEPAYGKGIATTDLERSREEYAEKVAELKKRIVAGDIVQAVPSRRVRFASDVEPLDLYRRLRTVNPSPYMFYLDYGTHQFIGASPESLVRVRDGIAAIHPIAGTRRRGKDDAEDESLAKNLKGDPKERAEHLMLVDLARNDLGRVCEPGSVETTKYMECEKFSHVIHLVSDVQGRVAAGKRAIDVLRSAFPAGTVSGAPKISAIEILSGLEKVKRRFYAGAVGYMESDGDLDFCIAIRCCLKQGKTVVLQAGGGIVAASDADREFEETNEKLGAMRAVLEGEN
ncbi:MAG: chorismate-binding protein [Fibrobacterales bacterium]|nr:chorismate-binding protein [Fibrobacterales bacterium]